MCTYQIDDYKDDWLRQRCRGGGEREGAKVDDTTLQTKITFRRERVKRFVYIRSKATKCCFTLIYQAHASTLGIGIKSTSSSGISECRVYVFMCERAEKSNRNHFTHTQHSLYILAQKPAFHNGIHHTYGIGGRTKRLFSNWIEHHVTKTWFLKAQKANIYK